MQVNEGNRLRQVADETGRLKHFWPISAWTVIRALTVLDAFAKDSPAIEVDNSLPCPWSAG